jgi:hypothetical protein
MKNIAAEHAKAELECLLLRITHIECLKKFITSHPRMTAAVREQRIARLDRQHAALTLRHEQRHRYFLRRFGAHSPLHRIPTQLRRLLSRVFCRPVPMRHTYPLPTGDDQ